MFQESDYLITKMSPETLRAEKHLLLWDVTLLTGSWLKELFGISWRLYRQVQSVVLLKKFKLLFLKSFSFVLWVSNDKVNCKYKISRVGTSVNSQLKDLWKSYQTNHNKMSKMTTKMLPTIIHNILSFSQLFNSSRIF